MTRSLLVQLVRSLGAIQMAVAVFLLLPRLVREGKEEKDWPPHLVAAVAGGAVFFIGCYLEHLSSHGAVVARGYLVPLAAVTVLDVLLAKPCDWETAVEGARGFLSSVFALTPLAVYPACAAFACLTAKPKGPPTGFYRH